MRIMLLAVLLSALIIGMFYKLERGDAMNKKILTQEQRQDLKKIIKPPPNL